MKHVVGKGCVVEQGVVGKGGECGVNRVWSVGGVVELHVVGSGCVVEQERGVWWKQGVSVVETRKGRGVWWDQ